MGSHMPRFAFEADLPASGSHLVLESGKQFRLDFAGLEALMCSRLPKRTEDLLRIAVAVYAVDRLAKRGNPGGLGRKLALRVPVQEIAFWRGAPKRKVESLLEALTDDIWDFHFVKDDTPAVSQQYLVSAKEKPIVTLYSGGLDSAAGLAHVLRGGNPEHPRILVTVWHQHLRKRAVEEQLRVLGERFKCNLSRVIVKTSLVYPPRMSDQNLLQRARSFLFYMVGGAVALLSGAEQVEVLENGVGIVNLPLMCGMFLGARNSRSCHPAVLRLAGELLGLVAERPLVFATPCADLTKAEMVKGMVADGLKDLARSTVSCVHYPLRRSGPRQCGVCPACVGRIQAMLGAGVVEPPDAYQRCFAEKSAEIPEDELRFLKAVLFQVCQLEDLALDGYLKEFLALHLGGLAGPVLVQRKMDNVPVE